MYTSGYLYRDQLAYSGLFGWELGSPRLRALDLGCLGSDVLPGQLIT